MAKVTLKNPKPLTKVPAAVIDSLVLKDGDKEEGLITFVCVYSDFNLYLQDYEEKDGKLEKKKTVDGYDAFRVVKFKNKAFQTSDKKIIEDIRAQKCFGEIIFEKDFPRYILDKWESDQKLITQEYGHYEPSEGFR